MIFLPHASPSQSVFLFSPPFYYPQQFSLTPSHICNIVTEVILSSLKYYTLHIQGNQTLAVRKVRLY